MSEKTTIYVTGPKGREHEGTYLEVPVSGPFVAQGVKSLRGLLVLMPDGEADDILGLVSENKWRAEPFARSFEGIIGSGRKQVSVRYFLTDEARSVEQLNDALAHIAEGFGEAEYNHRYSEITGYLWTDEEAVVGGHDLVKELRGSLGKHLYMEVTVHTAPVGAAR